MTSILEAFKDEREKEIKDYERVSKLDMPQPKRKFNLNCRSFIKLTCPLCDTDLIVEYKLKSHYHYKYYLCNKCGYEYVNFMIRSD